MKRKILLSAILSLSVAFSPAFSEVLSDEELEEVDAQGFQNIVQHHVGDLSDLDNNMDSVYLDEETQRDTVATYVVNEASSSLNAHQNTVNLSSGFSYNISQTNTQLNNQNYVNDASGNIVLVGNVNQQRQIVDIGVDIDPDKDGIVDNEGLITRITGEFDNNNNSVMMRDNALKDSQIVILVNSSTSAINAGMNQVTGGDFGNALSQINNQSGFNFNNSADSTGFALATNAEVSDVNALDGLINPDRQLPEVSVPTQHIINHFNRNAGIDAGDPDPGHSDSPNNPYNVTYIRDNNNNNNSVQSRDNVQENAQSNYLANTAKTAANFGFNIASLENVANLTTISQQNTQTAENHNNTADSLDSTAIAGNFNKETQVIDNMDVVNPIDLYNATGIIREQDNNNNSVQKKDDSERYAKVIVGHNVAVSAVNAGLNLLEVASLGVGSTVTQTNTQTSNNFNNTADGLTAYAENADLTPYKDRAGNIIDLPIGRMDKPLLGPGQLIHNVHATILEQNNNNNSVQLANDAQGGSSSDPYSFFESVNASTSAMNTGMNVIAVGFPGDLTQLFDEMLMATGTVGSNSITQTNTQTAGNHINDANATFLALAANKNKEIQWVDNCNCTDIASVNTAVLPDFDDLGRPVKDLLKVTETPQQNNNMNSVQIRDRAQRYATGVFMGNAANSAVNASMNFMTSGQVTGTTVTQTNNAVANNWNNTATGAPAIAGNFENIAW